MKNSYYVYMITNEHNSVLYTGVTNNLERRIFEHKNKLIPGFTSKYNLNKLVYVEQFDNINQAIENEKRIKGWVRIKKNDLIKSKNPNWEDLASEILHLAQDDIYGRN